MIYLVKRVGNESNETNIADGSDISSTFSNLTIGAATLSLPGSKNFQKHKKGKNNTPLYHHLNCKKSLKNAIEAEIKEQFTSLSSFKLQIIPKI